jgi:hypothetical protein
MDSAEIQALGTMVDDLIASTRRGSFVWAPVNPSTYVWEQPRTATSAPARMTLQLVERIVKDRIGVNTKKDVVILQVSELSPPTPVVRLKIDGSEIPDLNSKLLDLFKIAGSGVTEKGLDFLKSLLEKD